MTQGKPTTLRCLHPQQPGYDMARDRLFAPSGTEFAGRVASRMMISDPVYFTIYLARYKFLARILNGIQSVAEVGCGDGFGTYFLTKSCHHVDAFDIDSETLEDCRRRMADVENLTFTCHDFVSDQLVSKSRGFDALVMVDVLEHIHDCEEKTFLDNALELLKDSGLAVIGTPNLEAHKWASENSRLTHVNLKSAQTLHDLLLPRFQRVLLFGQNDEVLHTGFFGMCHYLWAVCLGPILR